jgi:hypothetical protein
MVQGFPVNAAVRIFGKETSLIFFQGTINRRCKMVLWGESVPIWKLSTQFKCNPFPSKE